MVALGRNTYSGARLLELVLVNCNMVKLSSNYKNNSVKIFKDTKRKYVKPTWNKNMNINHCYFYYFIIYLSYKNIAIIFVDTLLCQCFSNIIDILSLKFLYKYWIYDRNSLIGFIVYFIPSVVSDLLCLRVAIRRR